LTLSYFQTSPSYSVVKNLVTKVELSCHPLDGLFDFQAPADRPQSAAGEDKTDLAKMIMTGPETLEDREKWQLLSRELAQKQEIIHRMMREADDKGHSLKLTTAEVLDLRRTIKMLQAENAILRRRLGEEESMELAQLVAKEVSSMTNEELKAKVVRIAQAYRAERLRNEEFERALKSANVDLIGAKQLQAEYDNMQAGYSEAQRRLAEGLKEVQKTSLYKDTIKKQERVIGKLEILLEKTLKDT